MPWKAYKCNSEYFIKKRVFSNENTLFLFNSPEEVDLQNHRITIHYSLFNRLFFNKNTIFQKKNINLNTRNINHKCFSIKKV